MEDCVIDHCLRSSARRTPLGRQDLSPSGQKCPDLIVAAYQPLVVGLAGAGQSKQTSWRTFDVRLEVRNALDQRYFFSGPRLNKHRLLAYQLHLASRDRIGERPTGEGDRHTTALACGLDGPHVRMWRSSRFLPSRAAALG